MAADMRPQAGRFVRTRISRLVLEALPARVLSLLSVVACRFAVLPLIYCFLARKFLAETPTPEMRPVFRGSRAAPVQRPARGSGLAGSEALCESSRCAAAPRRQ